MCGINRKKKQTRHIFNILWTLYFTAVYVLKDFIAPWRKLCSSQWTTAGRPLAAACWWSHWLHLCQFKCLVLNPLQALVLWRLLICSLSETGVLLPAHRMQCFSVPLSWPSLLFNQHMRCDSGNHHWLIARLWHAWDGGGRAAPWWWSASVRVRNNRWRAAAPPLNV